MRTIINWSLLFFLLCLATPSLKGQPPVYTVTPDSAPPGVNRTLTVTATAPVTLSFSNCFFSSTHLNDPGRSIVPAFLPLCFPPGPMLVAGQSVTQTVPTSTLSAGTYWLKCFYNQGGTNFRVVWVDFRVEAPGDPLLSAPAPQWGTPWILSLAFPADPSAIYIAAASLGQTNRIMTGNLILSLEQDALFNLSFPTPDPLLFGGFGLGSFNANGNATLTMNLPPVSGLILGVHVQAAVIPIATPGPIILSNAVDAAVQ